MVLAAGLCVLAAEKGGEKPAAEKKPPPGPKKPVEYAPGKLVCWAANRGIRESSGVAASRTTAGVFWTHNDSGDGPNLYAFDLKGNSLGTFAIRAVTRESSPAATRA